MYALAWLQSRYFLATLTYLEILLCINYEYHTKVDTKVVPTNNDDQNLKPRPPDIFVKEKNLLVRLKKVRTRQLEISAWVFLSNFTKDILNATTAGRKFMMAFLLFAKKGGKKKHT